MLLGELNSTITFQIENKNLSQIAAMSLILGLTSNYDAILNALVRAQGKTN